MKRIFSIAIAGPVCFTILQVLVDQGICTMDISERISNQMIQRSFLGTEQLLSLQCVTGTRKNTANCAGFVIVYDALARSLHWRLVSVSINTNAESTHVGSSSQHEKTDTDEYDIQGETRYTSDASF